MADEDRKEELIAQIARTRSELTTRTRTVRREMDFGAKFKDSFRRHNLTWLAGAAVLGLALTLLSPRKKKVVEYKWPRREPKPEVKAVRAGIVITVLKIAFDFVRPALTKWLTGRVTTYATSRFGGRAARM